MVNWVYNGTEVTSVEQFPEGVIGFVYMITDNTNSKFYIGRKAIFSTRKRHFGKKEKAKITDKRKKMYEYVTKIMPKWKEYTGSCDELNEAISDGAIYEKKILKLCYSKQELTYYEVKYQMIYGVIEPTVASYNSNIGGKFYPKIFARDEK